MNVRRFFLLLLLSPALFAQTTDPDPTSGYGPPTAISPETSLTKPAARPKQNWIDQSQARPTPKASAATNATTASSRCTRPRTSCSAAPIATAAIPTRGLTKEQAHVLPRNKEFWKTSANPPNSNVWLNHESPEFIRFMNPGDLRVAKQACGLCHGEIIRNVDHSMMNHGAMLWGAALYNNGGFYLKNYRFGQAYGADGAPLRLNQLHAGHAGGHKAPRHPAVPRSAAALQPEQSRQYSAHFRKGRRKTIATRPPHPGRAARQTDCAACPSAASAR